MEQWKNFKEGRWQKVVDVDDFITNNFKQYDGDEKFLKGPSKKTIKLVGRLEKLLEKENTNVVLDIDKEVYSGIDNFDSGYLDRRNEVIVGLQTDEALKLMINPFVSFDSSIKAAKNNGYRISDDMLDKFDCIGKSHEDAVNDTYTKEIIKLKELNMIGSLPDNFGRGHIVSDFRRLALYGADYLIIKKMHDLERLKKDINYSTIRTREEVAEQIKALDEIKSMAKRYDIDISCPASNAKEAVQWIYFAILSAAKQTSGATQPLCNLCDFIDIYIERDLSSGILNEEEAQELIDQFILKLRLFRFLRLSNYHENFAGRSPIITDVLGGIRNNKVMISKTTYRLLNTYDNIGNYANPTYTIKWNLKLPEKFKSYCVNMMFKYNTLQFINDKVMSKLIDSEYTITGNSGICKIGKQIDYYGGAINLPKVLLYAINGGVDEITMERVFTDVEPITCEPLEYSAVLKNFMTVLDKVMLAHCDALNIIHYMHDKYAYEKSLMAFNDTVVERYMTFSFAGFSTVIDSLSAIKYSKVLGLKDENGLVKEFTNKGEYPRFGNNDDKADKIASEVIKLLNKKINTFHLYRNAKAKLSLDTNVINIKFGRNTGATPDGRFECTSFPFGINPVCNVNMNGVLEIMKSVIKLPVQYVTNGINCTFNISSSTFGDKKNDKIEKMITLLDSFFNQITYQLEINVLDKKYVQVNSKETKRDSFILKNTGCTVRYAELTDEQKENIFDRTFHGKL